MCTTGAISSLGLQSLTAINFTLPRGVVRLTLCPQILSSSKMASTAIASLNITQGSLLCSKSARTPGREKSHKGSLATSSHCWSVPAIPCTHLNLISSNRQVLTLNPNIQNSPHVGCPEQAPVSSLATPSSPRLPFHKFSPISLVDILQIYSKLFISPWKSFLLHVHPLKSLKYHLLPTMDPN